MNRPGIRLTSYKTVNDLSRCSETNTSRWNPFWGHPKTRAERPVLRTSVGPIKGGEV